MKKTVISTLSIMVLAALIYLGGIGYYSNRFQANTNFGSINVSNLTVAQAQEQLADELNRQTLTITENGQELGKISLADLDGDLELVTALDSAYNNQDPVKWFENFFKGSDYEHNFGQEITVDSALVAQQLEALGLEDESRQDAQNAAIDYQESTGYTVLEGEEGTKVDPDRFEQALATALSQGETSVEINQAYVQPEVTAEDATVTDLMDQIEQTMAAEVTLDIAGEKVAIQPETIEEWIGFDDNNQITLDEEAVNDFVTELNDKYATYDKSWDFESTLQGRVTVQPGTLGWSIDREEEVPALIRDITSGETVEREPHIVGSGYSSEGTGVGDSYVEVDLTSQTMFIYVDGQLEIETPIVSGMAGSSETIPGAYAIWDKEEDAILRDTNVQTGRDYEQPVSYWLPFDQIGQGIHDANWQGAFGGENYTFAGSQGCINTPPGIMPQVFATVTTGMPVMIFH